MKKLYPFVIALFVFTFASLVFGREARLVRYPSYSNGRIAFTYLGDIWTADETGQNFSRLTVNKARDAYPRFSPDGKWIAFSSDRNGNLDVFIIPASGGTAKQLTFHSADDTVLGWTPDGKGVLFSSQRGEDFMAQLYVVSVDGGIPWKAGPDMGKAARLPPDGRRIAYNPKGQVYWRKSYRGAYATDGWIEDVAAKKFTQLTDFDGEDSWRMWSRDGDIYFVSDRDGEGLTNIWRESENGGKAERVTAFKSGDVRYPSISSDGRVIVFEYDFGIWKLDTNNRKVTPIHLDIDAETEENAIETRVFSSEADDYDLAPNARRLVISIHAIYSTPLSSGAAFAASTATAGRAAIAGGGGGGGARRRINFTVRVKIDRPSEWAEMFGDAWRTMKYRFYDPAMHGKDWDGAKAKYEPVVKDVGDRQELLNIINEMIGELNASHTGAAPPPGGRATGGVSTGPLGI